MVTKKTSKKVQTKRKVSSAKNNAQQNIPVRKFGLVVRNFLVFLVLLVLSAVFYQVSSNELYKNFFWMTGFISAVISVALLIVWLAIIIKKKFL